MKNTIFKTLIFTFLGVLSLSCYDDKGDYDYEWVDKVVIDNIENVSILWNTTLTIKPELRKTTTKGEGDTINLNYDDYTYLWYVLGTSKLPQDTLCYEREINNVIQLPVGTHCIFYEMYEKSTGIKYYKKFNLEIVDRFTSVDLFLVEDDEGNVELELMGKEIDGSSTLVKDVLKSTGYPYTKGGANSVLFESGGNRIWIATGEATGYLLKNFTWEEGNLWRKYMINPMDVSYTASKITYIYPNVFFYTDEGNFHYYDVHTVSGSYMGYIYPDFAYVDDKKANIFPVVGGVNISIMTYDYNSKQLVSLMPQSIGKYTNQFIPLIGDDAAKGFDIISLQQLDDNTTCVIMKDPNTNTYWQFYYERYTNSATGRYSHRKQEIKTKQLFGNMHLAEEADHIVINRSTGFLYFSIGNKLYAYTESFGQNSCVEIDFKFDNITGMYPDSGSSYFYISTYGGTEGSGKVYSIGMNTDNSSEPEIEMIYDRLGKIKSYTKW